jgi:hemerythrin
VNLFPTWNLLGRHFLCTLQAEELLLAEAGFPELEAHRKLHRAYRREVIKLAYFTSQADPEAPAALDRFLGTWWHDHILGEDMGDREFPPTSN